ncbi:SUKH-3 domain-containing protein [Sebaldella sp. S0638]|uniref:SUKH-3 domain-containing protein n=1 Tax=Sebaldella sp. S0638 TaxID=2957809 RepID=UPI00209F9601|nr:SUKH-3 domain-containing protein [Sebaldella sp. S0638]
MYNFDKDILEALKKSGWHENREVSTDKILDYYSKVKYICNDMQLKFLKSFSNLEIDFENPLAVNFPRFKNRPVRFILDPFYAAQNFRMRVRDYEIHFKKNMIPIAEVPNENMVVFLAEDGVFYGGFDENVIEFGQGLNIVLYKLKNGITSPVIEVEDYDDEEYDMDRELMKENLKNMKLQLQNSHINGGK